MPRLGLSFRSLTLVVLLSSTAVRGEPPARTHEIQADDYFSIAVIADCAMSPDGKQVAYTELRWDEELNGRNS
ncbi:MAG TPA: hypothetical protein VMV94_06820, partial [Phycisphaerae bacterium]|nr:hypothetical protein [Phycisphaerae bacterium]